MVVLGHRPAPPHAKRSHRSVGFAKLPKRGMATACDEWPSEPSPLENGGAALLRLLQPRQSKGASSKRSMKKNVSSNYGPSASSISSLALAGNTAQAAAMLLELDAAAFASREIVGACEAVLAAHAQQAQGTAAIEFFQAVVTRGVVPTRACYKATMDAAAAAGDWKLAVVLFNELQSAAKADETCADCASARSPDLPCYRSVLGALRDAHQWQAASRIIETAIAAGKDAKCCHHAPRPSVQR